MEKPLLALHPPLALPFSHRWSWFLLSWVRAAMWGALLEVECRSQRLALSEEQRPTVTSRRWLVFPVPCVSQWGLVGRWDSEGVSGAATLSEGEEGGIAGSSLPISPADLATLGTRVPLSLPLLCKGGRRLVCSFPLLSLAQTGRHFSGDKATWLDAASSAAVLLLGDAGRGAVGWCFEMASSPQELAEMYPTYLLVEKEDIG